MAGHLKMYGSIQLYLQDLTSVSWKFGSIMVNYNLIAYHPWWWCLGFNGLKKGRFHCWKLSYLFKDAFFVDDGPIPPLSVIYTCTWDCVFCGGRDERSSRIQTLSFLCQQEVIYSTDSTERCRFWTQLPSMAGGGHQIFLGLQREPSLKQ